MNPKPFCHFLLALTVFEVFITIHLTRYAKMQESGGMSEIDLPAVRVDSIQQPIRLLITRTVSSSEASIVLEDLRYVQSFYHGDNHKNLMKESVQQCNLLKNGTSLSPYDGGQGKKSRIFPNYILCSNRHAGENNFVSVQADFMLFALTSAVALTLLESYMAISKDFVDNATTTQRRHTVDANIIDVSVQPEKIWNWIKYANEEALREFDYVWFIDGDVKLTSLNWHAFFTQVRLMRPKVSQPACIGGSGVGTDFKILGHQSDPRVIAAEVPIVEVMAPLLETEMWLKYRDFIGSQPEVMENIALGGEQCFDMGWCHFAKNNMTGTQTEGNMWDANISSFEHFDDSVTVLDERNPSIGRSCIVFSQTPYVHISKKTRNKNLAKRRAGKAICGFLRERKGVIESRGLHKVNELFVYDPSKS
jgi:hypothetical protein